MRSPDSNNNLPGYVYSITGLSGAGKTTIAKLFYDKLIKTTPNLVLLDGDDLRTVLKDKGKAYSQEGRLEIALTYARLCYLLSQQGTNVICATISMFEDVWEWNRENIANYRLIYVRVSIETLIKRDKKQLYSRALRKEIENVYGIDIPVVEPISADLVLDNEGTETPEELLQKLLIKFGL